VANLPELARARELVAAGLRSLPWEGLQLSHGEPAISTTFADSSVGLAEDGSRSQ
jgi:nicotinate phosphoribosyltransferase